MLTHLSLFSGIGGIDLAAEWAGFETVGQCEWADYPTKVLEKHWPDVPRWRDIRTLTGESFYERTGRKTVNLISGGFPCQPFSVAGKQRGKEDDRFLWPEMLRVISELRPTWVIGENVAGIVNMALDEVLVDLGSIGYKTQPFIIPAAGVGAHHRQDRVWIIAVLEHTADDGQLELRENRRGTTKGVVSRRSRQPEPEIEVDGEHVKGAGSPSRNVADPTSAGLSERRYENLDESDEKSVTRVESKSERCCDYGIDVWAVEPGVGRVANGISNRVDRLKCLGNAVVPQQVYPILKAIAELEVDKSGKDRI